MFYVLTNTVHIYFEVCVNPRLVPFALTSQLGNCSNSFARNPRCTDDFTWLEEETSSCENLNPIPPPTRPNPSKKRKTRAEFIKTWSSVSAAPFSAGGQISAVPSSAMETHIIRAVSRHDLSHQLVGSRNDSWSFPGGADYATYWASVLVGRIAQGEVCFSSLWRGPLGRMGLTWLASLS